MSNKSIRLPVCQQSRREPVKRWASSPSSSFRDFSPFCFLDRWFNNRGVYTHTFCTSIRRDGNIRKTPQALSIFCLIFPCVKVVFIRLHFFSKTPKFNSFRSPDGYLWRAHENLVVGGVCGLQSADPHAPNKISDGVAWTENLKKYKKWIKLLQVAKKEINCFQFPSILLFLYIGIFSLHFEIFVLLLIYSIYIFFFFGLNSSLQSVLLCWFVCFDCFFSFLTSSSRRKTLGNGFRTWFRDRTNQISFLTCTKHTMVIRYSERSTLTKIKMAAIIHKREKERIQSISSVLYMWTDKWFADISHVAYLVEIKWITKLKEAAKTK